MKQFVMFVLVAILIACIPARAQKLITKKDQRRQEVKELIESRNFRFVANSATSMGGARFDLTSIYDLEIENNHVKAFLPYYGVAYKVEYGAEGGIKFDANAEEIDYKYNEKKKIYQIRMSIPEKDEHNDIYMTVGVDGFATVMISFIHRQPITYSGFIDKPEKTDKN